MIKALKIIRLIMTHYDYNVILIMLAIFEQWIIKHIFQYLLTNYYYNFNTTTTLRVYYAIFNPEKIHGSHGISGNP